MANTVYSEHEIASGRSRVVLSVWKAREPESVGIGCAFYPRYDGSPFIL